MLTTGCMPESAGLGSSDPAPGSGFVSRLYHQILSTTAHKSVTSRCALDPISWTHSERWIRCPECAKRDDRSISVVWSQHNPRSQAHAPHAAGLVRSNCRRPPPGCADYGTSGSRVKPSRRPGGGLGHTFSTSAAEAVAQRLKSEWSSCAPAAAAKSGGARTARATGVCRGSESCGRDYMRDRLAQPGPRSRRPAPTSRSRARRTPRTAGRGSRSWRRADEPGRSASGRRDRRDAAGAHRRARRVRR
jgi:hypothetical protein